MAHTSETLPRATAGSGYSSSIGVGDGSENKPGEHTAQEATAALQRDFIAEALRVASIKAANAADDIDIRDDDCAERGIRLAIAHLRAAAATFREMQGTIEGIADEIRAEAVV
jgi:hypothetical protein